MNYRKLLIHLGRWPLFFIIQNDEYEGKDECWGYEVQSHYFLRCSIKKKLWVYTRPSGIFFSLENKFIVWDVDEWSF